MRFPKIVNGTTVTRVRFLFANATPPIDRKLLARGSVTFNDLIKIRGVEVRQKGHRIVVVMPTRPNLRTGRLREVAFAITPEGRSMVETAVLDAYLKAIAPVVTPMPAALAGVA